MGLVVLPIATESEQPELAPEIEKLRTKSSGTKGQISPNANVTTEDPADQVRDPHPESSDLTEDVERLFQTIRDELAEVTSLEHLSKRS